jgi:hypothetical protein
MKLDPTELLINSGVGDDIAVLLEQAFAAHIQTGRGASVVLKITVKLDKESNKSKARGRVSATIPEGDDDQHTKKQPSVSLLTVGLDHPDQQTLFDEAEPAKSDDLPVETVVARLNLAIAGTNKTVSAYAKKHGLPHIALTKLLGSGMVGDAASYGPIYDHALTLATDAETVAEQDGKTQAAG